MRVRISLLLIGVLAALWAVPGHLLLRAQNAMPQVPGTTARQAVDAAAAALGGARLGIQRVKEFCAQHVAKGNYFPGCPAQVREQE